MTKPGDVVEFKDGLFGIAAPRNIAFLLDRWRVKGVPWVRLMTVEGRKEAKAEHLTRRAFKVRHDGRLDDDATMAARLRQLLAQHESGGLAEESEDDLDRLEESLWQATCDQERAWTEPEVAAAHYGVNPSPQQLRNTRDALDRCRRAGRGRFQTVGGRGDTWRPWTRAEADRMRKAWQDLAALRAKLVVTLETEEGRTFQRVPLESAGLDARDQATLAWVKAAMAQFVEWDGVPDGGEPVAGIGGLGATQVFGMDLHRQLGFLAADWIAAEPTTVSSDYVQFLLGAGLWSAAEAVDALIRRHVNQEEFFEHTDDPRAEEAAGRFPEPDLAQDPQRTDLRGIPCWTIDPPDARDFDDAVGIEAIRPGLERLWVHVADVSHYVTPDSTLDRHAKRRATSVYLPGRVLPMLPRRLSDHLCSLRSDGDRFALSVGLDVDASGRVVAQQFHASIIRVTENLAYGHALERARAGQAPFSTLLDLAKRMRSHRRGLELETGELKVLLHESGFSALEKRADDATRMIETFMVAANEAVAAHLRTQQVPLLFRCHPLPEPDRVERFCHQAPILGVPAPGPLPRKATRGVEAQAESLLDRLKAGGGKLNLFGGGVEVASKSASTASPSSSGAAPSSPPVPEPLPGFSSLTPAEQEQWLAPFRAVVAAVAAMDDEDRAEVATLKLLGCMGRAHYTPDNEGHFGLASMDYCHFTSPIRRYPDLIVHRNLKWHLRGRQGPAPHDQASLRAMCDHCSDQERAADGLERRIKASCLVLASLGQPTESRARVTGIAPHNLFVLRSDGIEARVAVRDLPGGPYSADEWESMLSRPTADGLEDEVVAKLADPVTVALAGRDVASGRTQARLVAWPNGRQA